MIDYKLEEWKSLRTEVGRKQSLIQRIIFGTMAINFAIYSFGTQNGKILGVFATMIPLFISAISHYWTITIIHSTRRITYYIKARFEQPDGFFWETSLNSIRQKAINSDNKSNKNKATKITLGSYYPIFYLFFITSPLISIALLINFKIEAKMDVFNFFLCCFIIAFITLSTWFIFNSKFVSREKKKIEKIDNLDFKTIIREQLSNSNDTIDY